MSWYAFPREAWERVFANWARRNVRVPNFWKAGIRFLAHRRSFPVKMPHPEVRRFSPPFAAAPPGNERKPGFRLSVRAFKCDAAGFQRTLVHAGNCRPTRETRAPAGMTGHGNAGVKKNGISAEATRIRFRHGIPAPFFALPCPALPTFEPRRSNYGLVLTSANPFRHSPAILILTGFSLRISAPLR